MKDRITQVVTELFEIMEMTLDDMEIAEQEQSYLINLKSDRHASLLIGRDGQNLLALQHLLRLILSRQMSNPVSIVLDINDYRTKQREELLAWADQLAGEVAAKGETVKLEPMSAYERRLIHLHLADHPHVLTVSEGDEPSRMVVIKKKDSK